MSEEKTKDDSDRSFLVADQDDGGTYTTGALSFDEIEEVLREIRF